MALIWAAMRIMRPHVLGGSADAASQKPGPAAAALGTGRGENRHQDVCHRLNTALLCWHRDKGEEKVPSFSREEKVPFLNRAQSQCWTNFLLQRAKKTAMGKTKAGKMLLALAGTMQLHSKCLKQWAGESQASHLTPGLPSGS